VGSLEAASPVNAAEAIAYLSRAPFDNVYVQWLLESGQLDGVNAGLVWRDAAESVAGFCYFGPQVVPNADDDAAFEAFAAHAIRTGATRTFVGPRHAVERVWSFARSALSVPRAIRTSQPVYALDRAALRGSRNDADVAPATNAEVYEIAMHSATMIAGEIGLDADKRPASAEFVRRTARIIDAGWWWRYRVDGRLAFMCNVGSATAATAQLQGVWTPPEMRGHGHATLALGAICDRLLEVHPTLCLYVNDFNLPAIALYERVGFFRAGEFSTIFL